MNSTGNLDESTAIVVSRDNHCVSRKNISESALKVLYRLNKVGYDAYLVGGGVRDLLLGLHPKDFDVATNALPEQAAAQFKNSRLIGRRFRLLHVRFGREIIEVATFRGHHSPQDNVEQPQDNNVIINQDAHIQDGMILRDNVYGSISEDAWRRDFTVNALYYNVKDFSVWDYTGGMQDLEDRVLRCIGDATQRYQEDPVRMIRAIRLAAKLDFTITPQTADPIKELAHKLAAVPAARLFEEVLKLFMSGCGVKTFRLLNEFNLFSILFPQTAACIAEKDSKTIRFIEQGLENTDARIAQGKPVTPAFLFAIMLWHPTEQCTANLYTKSKNQNQALQIASAEVISRQVQTVLIPKRFSVQVKEIWSMQNRLTRRQGKRAVRLLSQARFRAGYDFLLLRAQSGEAELQALGDWWTTFQECSATEQNAMVRNINDGDTTQRRQARKKTKKT
ncbi:MAG: polynucleotide adenylyltransferase PcnB [Thiohalomonadales bacterium]